MVETTVVTGESMTMVSGGHVITHTLNLTVTIVDMVSYQCMVVTETPTTLMP